MIKLRVITQLFMWLYISSYGGIFIPTSYSMTLDIKKEDSVKTNLSVKYYQQALFYYFQGDYSEALNILGISKLRLGTLDQATKLFEAGLQVNMGLQEQAKQTLLSFSTMGKRDITQLQNEQLFRNKEENSQYKENVKELLVLASLSLTEQYISQGKFIQAQQTLARMKQITPRFYQQYHVLSQLAYWPETPQLLPLVIGTNANCNVNCNDEVKESPYIQLNKALRFIEKGEFIPAIDLLTSIKSNRWRAPEQTFWQLLFSKGIDLSIEKQTELQLQNQAIKNYARLLLAHLYAQQESYQKVFVELKSFPKNSPYTEPALFLFAFSAQKIKQYPTALSLLTYIHKQYPYSHLGWQAGLLIAKQITEKNGLQQGWHAYQDIEAFFLDRIKQLNQFEKSYLEHTDLLTFSMSKITLDNNFKAEQKPYTPESNWLKKAINEVSLNSLYLQLNELTAVEMHIITLQRKNDWIGETIILNTKRNARMATSQTAMYQQDVYQHLLAKRESLSSGLALILSEPQKDGVAFASKEEQVMLERLNQSKESLAYIIEHGSHTEKLNIDDYQQRISRLSAVLSWQLKQHYPERAWQHKEQLAALDKSLIELEGMQHRVSLLLASASNGQSNDFLSQLTNRHIKEGEKFSPLSKQLNELKSKVSLAIRIKVSAYINEQRNLLRQHLLITRSAMAGVLEEIVVNDNQIDNELDFSAQNLSEQGL